MTIHILCVIVCIALFVQESLGNYVQRDFVQMSMRRQMSTVRYCVFRVLRYFYFIDTMYTVLQAVKTDWLDLTGAHCPKFGVQGHALLPLPGTSSDDGTLHNGPYNVQLSFDGGRIVTPWLGLKGQRAPKNPVIHVELVRSGGALTRVRARVIEHHAKNRHEFGIHESEKVMGKVMREFHDPKVWPKHVLIKYTWKTRHETDVDAALMAALTLGLVGTVLMGIRSMASYKKHLIEFFNDVVDEAEVSSSSYSSSKNYQPQQQRPMVTPPRLFSAKAD